MKGVSGRSVHLSMFWGEQPLSVGSGFIVKLNNEHFLVTARHNLSGRHWETNELLSGWSIGPNRLVVRMQASNPGVLEWTNRELALVDESDAPLWFEHPEYGRRADIAVLPLPQDDAYFVDAFAIERPPASDEPLLSAGDDLFVVGFPRGFTPYIGIPVWIRASIASEPAIGYKGLPIYLVDARTTSGQSGAAVVLRPGLNRAVKTADGNIMSTGLDDSWIVGVYTGRVSLPGAKSVTVMSADDEEVRIPLENFDIGMVWNTGAILTTVEGRTRFPVIGDGGARWEPEEDWGGSYDALIGET